jgi:hypothetical protein
MAYATHNGNLRSYCDRGPTVAGGVRAKLERLTRSLTYALDGPRRRVVDREIARLLAQSGGQITDSVEREIMRKAFASDWSVPQ